MDKSSPFLDYRLICPELKLLKDNFEEVRKEYLISKNNLEFKDFTKEQKKYISENKKGYPVTPSSYFFAKRKSKRLGWHLAGIYGGGVFNPSNAKYLPTLVSLLAEIKNITVCGINILDPGIFLDWHNDSEYSQGGSTLRTLWGLNVPSEENLFSIIQMVNEQNGEIETKNFKDDVVYSFFPNTIHRVENKMTKPRDVLAIDIFIGK